MTAAYCGYCTKPILMMVQKGTGFCSPQCLEDHERYVEDRDWVIPVLSDPEHRLEALKLPTRIHNLLVDAGYTSVEQLQGDVSTLGWAAFCNKIQGFGYHSSVHVQDRLSRWVDGRDL